MTEPNITEILLADLRLGAAGYPSELRDIEIALVGRELRRAYALDGAPERVRQVAAIARGRGSAGGFLVGVRPMTRRA